MGTAEDDHLHMLLSLSPLPALFSATYVLSLQALEEAGVIPGGDMTPEAALCKLSYVLGKDDWTSETRRKASK